MRIAIVTETFSPKMGYSENAFSKSLAKLGATVDVITADLFPYHQVSELGSLYQAFNADTPLVAGQVEKVNGFTLHVLPHQRLLGYMRLRGLAAKLRSIRPDIVQCFSVLGWYPLDLALLAALNRFKLFTGNHTTAS